MYYGGKRVRGVADKTHRPNFVADKFHRQHLSHDTSFNNPIIVAGDFNLNIRKAENGKFLEFMKKQFQLQLASSNIQSITLGGSFNCLISQRDR